MQPGLQSKAELIESQPLLSEGYISFPRGQRFQCLCISCSRGWSGECDFWRRCLLPNEVQPGIWILELSCGSLYDYESLLGRHSAFLVKLIELHFEKLKISYPKSLLQLLLQQMSL
ncbi:unnamed protein product [Camellia sinensis]